ncbi:MAG: nicotinate (nicotinamide) nucleotide adenylyltransferase [Microbacter sp.]
MKHIILFPGSFNPVHAGHLILANYAASFIDCDEVWLMVSPHNPLKNESSLIDAALRFRWVKMALNNHPKIKATDYEFSLPQPTYTYSTLQSLQTAYPNIHFSLLIGADNWLVFNQWKEYRKIIGEIPLLIYPRPQAHIDETTLPPHVSLVQAPMIEISSSMIRQALQKGIDVQFFMPSTVYDEAKRFFRNAE